MIFNAQSTMTVISGHISRSKKQCNLSSVAHDSAATASGGDSVGSPALVVSSWGPTANFLEAKSRCEGKLSAVARDCCDCCDCFRRGSVGSPVPVVNVDCGDQLLTF